MPEYIRELDEQNMKKIKTWRQTKSFCLFRGSLITKKFLVLVSQNKIRTEDIFCSVFPGKH